MKLKKNTFCCILRKLGIVLALIVLLGSGAIAQNDQNLLVNPGFEDAFKTGWSNWMPDNNVIETDPANVHGGAQSVALKPVNWSGSGFGQTISTGFTAGQIILFSGYGKVKGATSSHISIQLKDAAGTKTNFNSPDFANTGSYDMQTLVVEIPAGTVDITPNVWYDNNDGSILYVDDLIMSLQGSNMLVNPDFEDGLASGWANWMPDNNKVETDPANVQSGAKSVSLHPVNWSGSGFGQSITKGFTAGETCVFAGYGKVTGATSGHVSIQFIDAAGIKTNVSSPDFANTGTFVTQSVSAVIPDGTVEVIPNIWYDNNDGSVLTVDNFTLSTPYKAPVVENILGGTGNSYKPSYINVTGGGEMPDISNGITLSCDGTGATDVTASIQAALDDASSQGKVLLIPYTTGFYKISNKLNVKCSVIGTGGMPTIKQTNNLAPNLRLLDNMTGWIYNLHLVGTYDGTPKPLVQYEFGHNITLQGVNGVTIKNNLMETPQGDNIGNDGGVAQNTVRNVLITNNTLVDPWRCNVSIDAVVDRMAIMNNKLFWYSQYVEPIDIEPYQNASKVTNIEFSYNDIQSSKPALNDETHFYQAIFLVTGWWDTTPGGNIITHHNWGNWGVPFTMETGYQGGASTWTNILSLNNVDGTVIPGTDLEAPSMVKNLSAKEVTKTSFILSWEASTDNVGVVGYLVYKNDSIMGMATASPFKVAGMKCGNAYQMTVKAYDADGNISAAGQANVATLDCAGGTNLLLNPGFEDGLTNWVDWGGTALETTTVRSGVNALKTGTGDGGRAQVLTSLIPGNTYVLSAFGMLTGTGDFYKQSAYIGADIRDASGTRINISTSPIIDSVKWAQTTLTFTLPDEAASVTVYTYFEAKGIATNSVLTDDWSLVAFTPVTGLTVAPAKITIAEGIVKQLKVAIAPENASNKDVIWASSDTTIVSVNSTGMIQAKMVGTANVTATSKDGGKISSCAVTVGPPTNNLLINPGIEQALSVGWTGDWGSNNVITTEFHSGTKCLAIGPNVGGRTQLLSTLIPGSTYTLSTWGKLSGTGGFAKQKAYIGADIRDAANVRLAIPTAPITDSLKWSQTSFTFTMPLNAASVNVYIYYETRGITTNYVLTDDWGLISGWKPLPYIPTAIFSNKRDNFNMYPNPLTGQSLYLEGIEEAKSISIYDMTGRLMMNQNLQKTTNQSVILNEKLIPGSYIVKIATSTESLSKLLIVQ